VTTRTDVVILGGGPVGCLLAVLLDDMGVANVLVERDTKPYQLPRAIVMDDEIQRALHDHGMGGWLEAHTSRLEAADFTDAAGTRLLGMDIPAVGLQGVPPVVAHYQPELDAMLRAEAVRRGTDARFGRTVVSMEDRGGDVLTTLDDGGEIVSRWFVGCDGASSWTRRRVGIDLEDLRFDQPWLVVDIELHDEAVPILPVGVRQYCDPARPTTYVKGKGRYRRWEFQVQPDDDEDEIVTEAALWRLLAPWVGPQHAHLVRRALYRFHAVVATRWRDGNVFLVGDSAHQMPPFLGQGLNSGMRDAINLAWKMSLVVRGVAGDALLDTYGEERGPHARSVVAHAVDSGLLIDQLAGRNSAGIDPGAGYGGARPAACIESGLVFGDDPRVGHQFWHHPEVSRAVRAGGASFVLVTCEPVDPSPEWDGLPLEVVVAPDAAAGSWGVLVRPDRYVAAVLGDPAGFPALGTTVVDRVR